MNGTFLDISILLVASVALVKSVDMFIKSTSKLAHKIKISAYTISFLLVAVGTSLPEASIAVTSGLQGNSILSFGDAIGSNIALMTLVIAIPAIIGSGLSTRAAIHSKDIYFTAIFSTLPLALIIDGTLSRIDGAILLVSYIVYAGSVLKKASGLEELIDSLENNHVAKSLVMFVISMVILVGSSQLLVKSALDLSIDAGLELGLVGLILTSIGTSLPEIALSIRTAKHEAKEQILGDIIGSVVANSTVVLGLASVLHPIKLGELSTSTPTLFAFVLILLVFLQVAKSKQRISKPEGILLILFYIMFVTMELLLGH